MATDLIVGDLPDSEATRRMKEVEAAKLAAEKQKEPKDNSPVAQPEPKVVIQYPDDVRSLLEKARQEEKSKLYDRIKRSEAIESENVALKARTADLEINLKTLNEKMTAAATSPKKKDVDVDAIVNEAIGTIRNEVSSQLEALKKENDSLKTMQQMTKLDAIRSKLIAESNGKIISALVRGNTEEELQASAIEAKAEYEKIIRSVTPSPVVSAQPNMPAGAAPTPIGKAETVSSGMDGNPGLSELEKVAQDAKTYANPKDWEKVRMGLREKLKKAYNSPNPMIR